MNGRTHPPKAGTSRSAPTKARCIVPLRTDAREALVGEVVEAGGDQSKGEAEDDQNEPFRKAGWYASFSDLVGEAKDQAEGETASSQPIAFEAEGFDEFHQAEDDDQEGNATDEKLSEVNHLLVSSQIVE